MPITFAHPAAVLPFMGGPCVPAALVAGALAPDVPYFLRALRIPVSAQSWWEPFLNATTTHNWPGALIITIPLAFFLYAFIVACARPALWVLPESGVHHKLHNAPWRYGECGSLSLCSLVS